MYKNLICEQWDKNYLEWWMLCWAWLRQEKLMGMATQPSKQKIEEKSILSLEKGKEKSNTI